MHEHSKIDAFDLQPGMEEPLSADYRAAVGSVMAARKRYEALCEAQGAESWAAQQAHEYLLRELEHRSDLRHRYEATLDNETDPVSRFPR